jgi:hypothetical protein
MKKITIITLGSLLWINSVMAQAPVFTTLTSTDKNIFAGVKSEQKGMEPETYLLEIEGDKLTSSKVKLPIDIQHREIVALFPAEKGMLLVLSQRTVEQGDHPQIHTYNPVKKEWKKIAESTCSSFAKLKVESSAITFSCVETDKKGEEVETQKKVGLQGINIIKTGEVTLPQVKVDHQNIKAELLGEVFEWKQLKVGFNKKEKIFTP